ncbi:unnamed protein product, partial [Medioppia subpectinata]
VPTVGRGRGKFLSNLPPPVGRTQSPPRTESSSSSSSGQPSPSGPVGSPPEGGIASLTIDDDEPVRMAPQEPDSIANKQRGTDGNPINLILNYIKLKKESQSIGIFEYHIYFKPQIDSRQLRAKILKQTEVAEKIGPVYQFTGMNLFLNHKVEDQTIDTTTPIDGSAIKVELQFVKIPPANELMPFYNTIIRKIFRALKLVQIQRHYYDPLAKIEVPQHKLEIWPGWAQAVQELDDGLLLVCDASHRLLRTSTARDVLQDLFRTPDGKQRFKEYAQKRLVGCIVLTRYNNKPYRVDDIDFSQNPMSTFDWNGTPVTYVEYFKKSWQVDIKDLKQPLLVHRPKPRRGEEASDMQMICLIPEICYMTGLTDDIRADNRVMRDIASHTRIKPTIRMAKLQEFIDNVRNNPNARKFLTDWGLDMDDKPYHTQGRTMMADKIVLGNGHTVPVGPKADWARDATNNALFHTININKWVIVFTQRDAAKVDEFVKTLKAVTRMMGFTFGDPDKLVANNDMPASYINAIKGANVSQAQIIVCMTPGSSQREDRYNAIKRLCYCELGMPNQVVRANTLSDAKMRSVCQKIAIQMSCKVGGQPWALPIPFKSCMIVGIDVYHDPTQKGKSVVGMVASVNQAVSQWYSRVFFQNAHTEIVNTIESGIVACLKKFYEVNNSLPQRIFVYRDGVSDGQLHTVYNFEVQQLMNSVLDFGKAFNNYEPQVSYVVVQKRINAKLMMKRGSEL